MLIRRKWALVLVGLPLGFMIAFFLVPFLVVFVASFQTAEGSWTLENYARLVEDSYYPSVLMTTFRLSLLATLASFAIGYPIAYYIVYVCRSRITRRLLYIAVIMPLFTSNIVRSFGWIVLLGRKGVINETLIGAGLIERPLDLLFNEFSIVVGLTYILAPFMVLTISGVLQTIERTLVDASMDLGAGRLDSFCRVTFPLSLPGVIAGSLIVFTLSVSAYVVPAIMSGGRTIVMPMIIFDQYGAVFDFNFGAALAVGLLVVTLLLISLGLLFVDRNRNQKTGA